MWIQPKNIGGDESTLIIDGLNARQEILMCIHEATHTIRIRMYMWRDDVAGNMILSALRQKTVTHPDIQIFIEKDTFGSWVYRLQRWVSLGKKQGDIFWSSAGQELLKNTENIHFSYIGSWLPISFRYLRENDHSKIFVFDEGAKNSIALIWGMNIADEYLNPQDSAKPAWLGWHDYMVKLKGKLADSISKWKVKKKTKLIERNIQRGVEIFETIKNKRTIRKRILMELSQAKSSIIIEHGYLTDRSIIRWLRQLSRSGIRVQVILPSDSDGAWHANRRSIYRLLRPSLIHPDTPNDMVVYLYPGMIHAKVALIDDSVAIIGSANFTYGSLDFLHETNVIFRTKWQVVNSLYTQLQEDIAISRRVSRADIDNYSRILAWIQAIFI